MAKSVKVLRIFVSSPKDVDEERNKLKTIIDAVNKEVGSDSGIQLELIGADTDVLPGVGEYPQDVINKHIADDYDIYIGILWNKFGTPTKVWGSGTEEEFERAFTKNTLNPGSVNIMFYFSVRKGSNKAVEPKEIEKIKQFQNRLGGKGVYWNSYKTITDFEQKLRLHLHKTIKDYKKTIKARSTTRVPQKREKTSKITPSLKVLFEHDENGKPITGSADILIDAITKGHQIRIQIHHSENNIQIMDAPLLSVENGVVHASDIRQLSKTRDKSGNYIYQENPYHYYVIVSSNGHFHAKRINLDGKERYSTNGKKHVAWIALILEK